MIRLKAQSTEAKDGMGRGKIDAKRKATGIFSISFNKCKMYLYKLPHKARFCMRSGKPFPNLVAQNTYTYLFGRGSRPCA